MFLLSWFQPPRPQVELVAGALASLIQRELPGLEQACLSGAMTADDTTELLAVLVSRVPLTTAPCPSVLEFKPVLTLRLDRTGPDTARLSGRLNGSLMLIQEGKIEKVLPLDLALHGSVKYQEALSGRPGSLFTIADVRDSRPWARLGAPALTWGAVFTSVYLLYTIR